MRTCWQSAMSEGTVPSACRRLPENTSVRVYLRCVITSSSLSFSEATTDRGRGGGGGGIEGERSEEREEHADGERGATEGRAYCFLSDSTDRGALAFGGTLAAFEELQCEAPAFGVFEELECGASGVFEGLENEELVDFAGEYDDLWRTRCGRRTGLTVGTYSASAPSITSCFEGLSTSSKDGLE